MSASARDCRQVTSKKEKKVPSCPLPISTRPTACSQPCWQPARCRRCSWMRTKILRSLHNPPGKSVTGTPHFCCEKPSVLLAFVAGLSAFCTDVWSSLRTATWARCKVALGNICFGRAAVEPLPSHKRYPAKTHLLKHFSCCLHDSSSH